MNFLPVVGTFENIKGAMLVIDDGYIAMPLWMFVLGILFLVVIFIIIYKILTMD